MTPYKYTGSHIFPYHGDWCGKGVKCAHHMSEIGRLIGEARGEDSHMPQVLIKKQARDVATQHTVLFSNPSHPFPSS